MNTRLAFFVAAFLSIFPLLLSCPAQGGENGAASAGADSGEAAPAVSAKQAELAHNPALPVERIKLPPGFSISVYAYPVPGARSLCLSPKGVLFVGTRDNNGKVYSILDDNGDGAADKIHTFAEGLFMPNGVAVKDGALYVAEVNRILRYDGAEASPTGFHQPVLVTDEYPSDTHHGWKFIRFGADGMLYVPVGAPCNVCERDDPYASITRLDVATGEFKVIARGIRNTVGFDWDPLSGDLWFTDNGRDMLGDDIPPDELNHMTRDGQHFGFPYMHGKNIKDPEFGDKTPGVAFTPAAQELGPHVASLGMRFYTGKMFPEEYRNQIFIAEHGSWNRSSPLGARVTLVRLDDSRRPKSYEVFAEGWQGADGKRWGRPVDVLVMPDGALLVSDDMAGAVYRIAYAG
ncbi:MAG: sorbosone dehydrogenase family protein [bacterium]|jgi:glucose/arabinose dehydrogenase